MSFPIQVTVGGTPIAINTSDAGFRDMLHRRYAGFIDPAPANAIELEIDLVPATEPGEADDLHVWNNAGIWTIERGDFHATYNPQLRRGTVRQSANPWSIDAVIRIIHSLELAGSCGFLIHAASAVRNDRAFIFAGASGAGKTTISGLAPEDVALLTDEISYVRKSGNRFHAWGTPFAGELGRPGKNISARIGALYFLEHGGENRLSRLGSAEAITSFLKNVLFFADDAGLVRRIFENAFEFLDAVEVFRLSFVPDARVWSLIE